MKRIILTERQYKRLVRQSLNESERGDIVFEDPEDEKDVDSDIDWLLGYLKGIVWTKFQKVIYVKRIEGGKVYLDTTKYTDEEVDVIIYAFQLFSEWKSGYEDRVVGNPNDLTFDIGHNTDYVPNIVTIDEPEEDTDDVVNVEYDIDKTYNRGEYINLVKNIAIQQMEKYKIPASITIAQAILESGDGNSDLAKGGKNHFGIKCHGWTGDKSYHDDDKPNDCFRNYDNISDSFEDHSKFLKKNSIYDNLFRLDLNDYKGWAKGLKSAGYATSSKYADTLISIIERDDLFEYDVNNESFNDDIANVEISGGGGDPTMGFQTAMVGGINNDWDGSMPRVLSIAKMIKDKFGVSPSSQKRNKQMTANDNVSDHWVKQLNSYAIDLPTGDVIPGSTKDKKGDKMFKSIVTYLGKPDITSGRWRNINIEGYRYQIGWRVSGHYNHVHVGVRKL